jgi:hypothetical protein
MSIEEKEMDPPLVTLIDPTCRVLLAQLTYPDTTSTRKLERSLIIIAFT